MHGHLNVKHTYHLLPTLVLAPISCYVQSLSPNLETTVGATRSHPTTMRRPRHILRSKLCLFFRNAATVIRSLESERCVSKRENELRILISNSFGFERIK